MSQISPVDVVRLLLNPDISNKLILQLAWNRAKVMKKGPLVSKLLGSLIVGVSSFIRVPQIKKITDPVLLKDRISVAKGLSMEGISLETLGYLIHVVYNKQNGNPFVNYGETFLLGLQNIAIILLIRYYNARKAGSDEVGALIELAQPIAIILAIGFGLSRSAPENFISGLQVLSIPISIVSKIPQIKKNYALKSTSHLSNITVGANVLGSFIRVFTTLQDFEKLGRDKVLLAGYCSSFALNAILAGQCLIYGKGKEVDEEK
ncbi:hypothetical protein CLIB1423_14S03422 [[Candida] railenensis]|uniref:Solute carrier family 66 member 3 n=1 Tax=[Candida] railenensis TaxID=45579 RepID=A0A9P0QSW9_9ASCO|nr:hypothetical protein CLIB1423_14S03422 [[Candida] railenensis]